MKSTADDAATDAYSLILLSDHLERLLVDPAFLRRADVEIVLADEDGGSGGEVVAAYSCFLAARSPFLHQHIGSLPAGEKLRLQLSELVPGGRHIGRDALLAVLGYVYTGRFKVLEQECVDDRCWHGACRPAIDFVIQSMYAASGFQIPALVNLCQRRLFEFVGMALDEHIIPIIHVASTCHLSSLLDQCIQRVATSTMNKYLRKQLTGDLYSKIKELCRHPFVGELLENDDSSLTDRERTVRNIHKALDSDDVNRVGRLLQESAVTLGDAFAIHYAAAYCKPKAFAELLKLDPADLNLKDSSGYTPLHMACMRQEPDIIISLLERGASVLESTPDGRGSLTICKKLVREKDCNKRKKHQKRKRG